jgi:hypothetical protein
MAAGEYESALPVALDAVQQGQVLFKPSPALQLFPLYLLAAQVRNIWKIPAFERQLRYVWGRVTQDRWTARYQTHF